MVTLVSQPCSHPSFRLLEHALLGLTLMAGASGARADGDAVLRYDALNRITRVEHAGGGSITYTYDAAGNVLRVVNALGPSGLFDDFLEPSFAPLRWRIIGEPATAQGFAEFPAEVRIDTNGRTLFSGKRIVVEARLAGQGENRDTSMTLIDSVSADFIYSGDTNYLNRGFFAVGTGPYQFLEPGGTENIAALGQSSREFMEYRWVIDGNSLTFSRGPTLSRITQSLTRTLGRSIEGRSFYLSIGAAVIGAGTWDWIRVSASSALPSTGSFVVRSNVIPGATFVVPAGKTNCRFDASGTWSAGPQSDPETRNADGVVGGNTLGLAADGVPIPTAPIQALVVKRSSTDRFEMVGGSRTLEVKAGENLSFMMNDATTFGYVDGNTGQLDVTWECR